MNTLTITPNAQDIINNLPCLKQHGKQAQYQRECAQADLTASLQDTIALGVQVGAEQAQIDEIVLGNAQRFASRWIKGMFTYAPFNITEKKGKK